MNPVVALRQVAFELERAGAPTYRVRAFRRAAQVVQALPTAELERRVADGTLEALPGIGPATASVVAQAASGQQPDYLARLLADAPRPARSALRAALRGDCHTHSDWSDGGSPPDEMAQAARDLGHEWIALTDHSPRLQVANGLSATRLTEQLALVRRLNRELAPFRILTGIEVDIREDGSLDQSDDLLGQLDVVVASVHSQLRMPAGEMTGRMVAAITSPHVDVLGHCTGRMILGRGRPESAFDPVAVFTACRDNGVAVEINCRPERQDPPDRLLRVAAQVGCLFAIDTDAHAPGQLDWLDNGCERAVTAGIGPDHVINTRPAGQLALRLRLLPLARLSLMLRPRQRRVQRGALPSAARRAFARRNDHHSVAGFVLDIKQAQQSPGEFCSVRRRLPEQVRCAAVILATMTSPQPRAADAVGCRHARQDGEPAATLTYSSRLCSSKTRSATLR